jgi:uncharacterized protein (TIGR03435 family)
MRAFHLAFYGLTGLATVWAQEFEVASVKPTAQLTGQQVNVGLHIDGAQVHINYISLKDYIAIAYRLREHQVVGPDWLASERFDIDAKLPSGASRDKVPEMLQALLADRFQLKLHHGSKDFPVWGIIAAPGGPKMKESAPDPAADTPPAPGEPSRDAVQVNASGGPQGVSINLGRGSSYNFADNRIEVRKLTMTQFADQLARYMDRPVVDMTNLRPQYDFSIDLTLDDYRVMLIQSAVRAGVSLPPEALRLLNGASPESLFSGLRGLGLKMEERKAPIDVVIVDSALKSPTAN